MAAVAAASEPEPPTTRQLSCRFNGGGWRNTRVVDYGFAIEVDQPSGETATYHFAVDTSPPRGGKAVDNFGESWLIAQRLCRPQWFEAGCDLKARGFSLSCFWAD